MNPGPITLLELLALDEKARFAIPSWRRHYVWETVGEKREVERLWQDLRSKCDGGKKYFCGVISVHKLEGEDVPVWEIVDGQQRIATLFLLLMALRDVCEKRGVDCTDLNNLLRTPKTNDCRCVLHDGLCMDHQVMNALTRRAGFSLNQEVQKESKVHQAYRYFVTRIESDIPTGSQEFLVSVLQGIEFSVQFVEITQQTRRSFELLDNPVKATDSKEVVPETPKKKSEVPLGLLTKVDVPSVPSRISTEFKIVIIVWVLMAIFFLGYAFWWRN